ncbi:MAG: hypothetical protein AAGU19_01660 [Prolixibacteraceae bacterium]
MNTEKILKIVLAVLMAISAILMISLIANISDNDADSAMNAWLNTNLTWVYILIFVTIAIVVLFSLMQTFSNKEAAKKGLITIGCAVVIFLLAYMLSSNELPKFFGVERFVEDGTLTIAVSKWIDTLLIVTYILLGATLAATVFWSLTRMVKK